jgi:diguanylate cyclase (GGDEF)-like protein
MTKSVIGKDGRSATTSPDRSLASAHSYGAPDRLGRLRRVLPQGRQLPNDVWARRHHGLVDLLWVQIPLLVLFANYEGYSIVRSIAVCSPLLLAGLVAVASPLPRWIRCASVSLGMVGGASVLVYFSHGAIEAHFQYFVVIAFLSLYQEWMPFLIAIGFVLVEHGIVGVIAPRAVYNHDLMPGMSEDPWKWAFIHASFLFAAGFANILAWKLTEHEALNDALTGLPNRAVFLGAVQRACENDSRTSAVLFIDLDNFKDVNDGFGHEAGDQLLRAISARLQGAARQGDLIARLGGDEFAVLLHNTQSSQIAIDAATRYLETLVTPFALDGLSLTAAASIGLVLTDDESPTAVDVMRNADLAMYEAKRNGGGQVTAYRPDMHHAVLNRATLESELRGALANDELVVHYQPLLSVQSGEIVGNEALVRWAHPTRGLLPPIEFIPAAEQSGLIVPLGRWVLRTACQQTATWQREHPDQAALSVSVNLSPRQLTDRQLINTVIEALSDAQLEPQFLCLEITEGAVIKDFDGALPKLRALKNIGVSLALDDFGTGYSSLSYLRQLPVDSLKIDRSFIADLSAGKDHSIVAAIISLAHNLGMSVTAEGVETEQQLAVLRTLSSNLAQGFLLGKPVSHQQMTDILDQQEPVTPRVG